MGVTIGSDNITVDSDGSTMDEVAALAGVTVTTQGRKRFVNVGDRQLVLNGFLLVDGDVDEIDFGVSASQGTVKINPSGTLQIGTKKVENGVTFYSTGVAIRIPRQDGRFFSFADAGIDVVGGTFNAYGGTIETGLMTHIAGGSTADLERLTIYNTDTDDNNQFRLRGRAGEFENVNIGQLTFDGLVFPVKPFFEAEPASYSFVYLRSQFQSWAAGNQEFSFANFDFSQNANYIDHEVLTNPDGNSLSGLFKYINNSSGSSMRSESETDNSREDTLETIQQVSFSITDLSGAGLSGVNIYARDYDDGNRVEPSDRFLDYAADRVYSLITDANGEQNTEVLTSVHTYASKSKVTADVSFRSKFLDNRDVFDFFFAHYNYNLAATERVLKGLGGTDVAFPLAVDALVSETDASITSLQSNQDNASEAYDGLKYQLVVNFAGETETTVTKIGSLLDAGDHDVVVSSTGSGLPTFDGSTITLNSSDFTGDIRTTGTVTGLENISGSVFDANGDSVINITTPAGYDDSIRVFLTLEDAEAETNQIASGSSIRYQSSAFGGATLFFRAETSGGLPAFGSHLVSVAGGVYDVNVATTSENAALGQILALSISNKELNDSILAKVENGGSTITTGSGFTFK
ncbi:hypothetical protein OAI07_01400 [Akkermansiaceae bacterium]|nr:hypothetical protein [Akkermansiaceae bacterium]